LKNPAPEIQGGVLCCPGPALSRGEPADGAGTHIRKKSTQILRGIMMTTPMNPISENNFEPAIRAYVRGIFTTRMANTADRTMNGRYTELFNEMDSLPLSELLVRLEPFDYGTIRRAIPDESSLPGSITFTGPDPVTDGGHMQVLRLGVELGKVWPDSQFELYVHDFDPAATEETIRAVTLRDELKYVIDLGPSHITLAAEEPFFTPHTEWSEVQNTYQWVDGDLAWRGTARLLNDTRVAATMTRGMAASKLAEVSGLEVHYERTRLIFEVDGSVFELDATDVFTGSSDVALPQLIADGVFAEVARAAGLVPTAKAGREEVGKLFVGL
jgi:hypothetical protein